MLTPIMRTYALQVRKPGRAYKTVHESVAYGQLSWAFAQHLVPHVRQSVRIVDQSGKVLVRATPKAGV